jgi:sRNA-binding carbon storage regulator CsrA
MFPIQDGLKQGDGSPILLSNFVLEHTIRKVQENQVGLKLNGPHKLLLMVNEIKVNFVQENREALIDASEEAGLEVNTEEN